MTEKELHEETLAIARKLIEKDPSLKEWAVAKFPELDEGEYEQIRKELIKRVDRLNYSDCLFERLSREKILDWLKKQEDRKFGIKDIMNIDETIYFLNEFNLSNRCTDEDDIQGSAECQQWLEGLKKRLNLIEEGWPQDAKSETTISHYDEAYKEWSDEDDYMLGQIIEDYENAISSITPYKARLDWLKSVKDRINIKKEQP